ncbi:MAG: GtrA family protein [Sphingobacteriia bacterium]|nr:GtrA family protein [Sphingobacteriia bacterium]NCC40513.1 GtrA family protein [Gammaproteobacteria bacterium]
MSALKRLVGQLGRFGLVGVVNTGIDFAVTNLLFLLLRPTADLGLLGISVVACLLAAANSYWMNSRWTFEQARGSSQTLARFALVAGVGLVVNSSVFLFIAKYLHLLVQVDPLLAINLAKLGGVGAAMVVTFLGYRLGVFPTEESWALREQTCLAPATTPPRWGWLGAILLLALAARLGFLALAPVVHGDAVNYSNLAVLMAQGRFEQVDSFWHSLYDFWQLPLLLMGLDPYPALVLASLIPGLLLLIPVYLLGRRLYGESAGLIAALLVAWHPRLVEYSVNGYAESFYLCAATWGIWGLTALFQGERGRSVVLAMGLGLGSYLLVRNEGLLLIILLVGLTADWLPRHQRQDPGRRRALARAGVILLALTAVYAALSMALLDTPGLFSKASNLSKLHAETLDMRAAARETYGGEGQAARAMDWTAQAANLLARWPQNLRYAAERLPGVLLSPVILFALLLPVLVRRRGTAPGDEAPLLLFTLWPLLFYPFVQLEPRLLFPTLIGVCLFGAGGLVASGQWLARQLADSPRLVAAATPGLVGLMLLLQLMLIPLLAWSSVTQREFHREVGAWIAANLPAEARIAGDGYGYINATSFWAGRVAMPRRWVETPEALGAWALEHEVQALILYEGYLSQANPELSRVLETGIPGMVLLERLDFPRVGWVTIWGPATGLEPVTRAPAP